MRVFCLSLNKHTWSRVFYYWQSDRSYFHRWIPHICRRLISNSISIFKSIVSALILDFIFSSSVPYLILANILVSRYICYLTKNEGKGDLGAYSFFSSRNFVDNFFLLIQKATKKLLDGILSSFLQMMIALLIIEVSIAVQF